MAFIPKGEIDLEEELIEEKPQKTFRDYYADPEFRRKHLARMQEKVECKVCGAIISRSNMSKHTNTTRHKQVVKKMNQMVDKMEKDKMLEILEKFMTSLKGT
jgi:hypothetical protein